MFPDTVVSPVARFAVGDEYTPVVVSSGPVEMGAFLVGCAGIAACVKRVAGPFDSTLREVEGGLGRRGEEARGEGRKGGRKRRVKILHFNEIITS